MTLTVRFLLVVALFQLTMCQYNAYDSSGQESGSDASQGGYGAQSGDTSQSGFGSQGGEASQGGYEGSQGGSNYQDAGQGGDGQSGGSGAAGGCYAVSTRATDEWCNENCRGGYCPQEFCSSGCQTLASG